MNINLLHQNNRNIDSGEFIPLEESHGYISPRYHKKKYDQVNSEKQPLLSSGTSFSYMDNTDLTSTKPKKISNRRLKKVIYHVNHFKKNDTIRGILANKNLNLASHLVQRNFLRKEIRFISRYIKLPNQEKQTKASFLQYLILKEKYSFAQDLIYLCGKSWKRTPNDLTPLMLAVYKGKLTLVKYILKRNVDINAEDKKGQTALHYASQQGNFRIISYLLEKGAESNKFTHKGDTPLHYASKTGSIDAVNALLAGGSSLNLANKRGETPVDVAKSSYLKESLKSKGGFQTKRGNCIIH